MTEKICEGIVRISADGYSSYLVNGGERSALICACPKERADVIFENIKTAPDYILCTCSEPKLAGAVKAISEHYPEGRICATGAALRNLRQMLNEEIDGQILRDGSVIELGALSLRTVVTPNLFWPDTMMLYCPEKSVLFSGRAFSDMTAPESYRHYPDFTLNMNETVKNIDAKIILPCIGGFSPELPCLEKKYDACVFFCSESGCTREMATAALEGLVKVKAAARIVDLSAEDDETIRGALYSCDKILIGAPTVNRGLPERVWRFLSLIDAAASSGREYFVFGSYGWSGEAVTIISAVLKSLRMEPLCEPFRVAFNPASADLEKIRNVVSGFFKER